MTLPEVRTNEFNCCANIRMLHPIQNSWEICHRCAKILLAAEHKMRLAYYLQNTDWSQRRSEFGFFDEPVIILFTIFY